MLKLYKQIETIWFRVPEKIRFVLVGGFNSLASYLIFLAAYFATGHIRGLSLIIQNVISINISIFTMRYYVFRARGRVRTEYAKSLPVYIFMLIINYPFLWVFGKMGVSAPIAQPIFIVLSAIGTYLLLKYFSFHSRPERRGL